jgi:hypothetical protein
VVAVADLLAVGQGLAFPALAAITRGIPLVGRRLGLGSRDIS